MSNSDPAFEAARVICREHARSFYFASHFLPRKRRYAAYAVYAFCRLLDDATDEATSDAVAAGQIARFEQILDDVYSDREPEVGDAQSRLAIAAFARTVREYEIPHQHFLELAAGCRMDLTINRYATWQDLQLYCYRVAGVVGLVMSKIFGLTDESAQRQAVMMGEAMQLTNIVRDVGEDLARGRIYLPAEDLARFGCAEADLSVGKVTESFRQLMQFEIARARKLYVEAAGGLIHLAGDGSRFTAAAMAVIYSGILCAIERSDYDVFTSRASISTWEKLRRLRAARRLSNREAGAPVQAKIFDYQFACDANQLHV